MKRRQGNQSSANRFLFQALWGLEQSAPSSATSPIHWRRWCGHWSWRPTYPFYQSDLNLQLLAAHWEKTSCLAIVIIILSVVTVWYNIQSTKLYFIWFCYPYFINEETQSLSNTQFIKAKTAFFLLLLLHVNTHE